VSGQHVNLLHQKTTADDDDEKLAVWIATFTAALVYYTRFVRRPQ